MTSTTSANPQPTRNDAEAIDWNNVAVEPAVMLRLQLFQQPAAAAGSQQSPRISDLLRATTEQLMAADARQMGPLSKSTVARSPRTSSRPAGRSIAAPATGA